jgi:hypothetical protein
VAGYGKRERTIRADVIPPFLHRFFSIRLGKKEVPACYAALLHDLEAVPEPAQVLVWWPGLEGESQTKHLVRPDIWVRTTWRIIASFSRTCLIRSATRA